MKKARSRRKSNNSSSTSSDNGEINFSGNKRNERGNANNISNGVIEKRKPTHEEAALTAKNFRLAKELNDLKVRHRDETKTVTKLTMQNMTLATRCREALNHITALKEELSLHRVRTAELLEIQRQQERFFATQINATLNSCTVPAKEKVRSGKKSPPPPPPPSNVNSNRSMESTNSNDEYDIIGGSKNHNNGKMNERKSLDSNVQSEISRRKPSQDEQDSSTDKFCHKNETTASKFGPISADFFLVSQSGSDSSPRVSDSFNEGCSPSRTGDKGIPSSPVFRLNRNKPNATSSMEAFEASFDTAFPSTFSTPVEEPPSLSLAFDLPEFSDPFFIGSLDLNNESNEKKSSEDLNQRPLPEEGGVISWTSSVDSEFNSLFDSIDTEVEKTISKSSILGISPLPSVVQSKTNNSNDHSGKGFNNEAFSTTEIISESNTATPILSSLDPLMFHTPELEVDAFGDYVVKKKPNSPTRPQKKNGLPARAQYIAATTVVLSEESAKSGIITTGSSDNSTNESETTKSSDKVISRTSSAIEVNNDSNHPEDEPSLNKKTTKVNNKQTNLSAEKSNTRIASSDMDIQEEIRRLDAIANAMTHVTSPISQVSTASTPSSSSLLSSKGSRRRVKQPISYTEPSIHSKLRRGDLFFVKKEVENEKQSSSSAKVIIPDAPDGRKLTVV